jgi:hypothetical protein
MRKPVGDANLRVYLAASHGDARLLTVGNNFLEAKLAVAENGDKCDKHFDSSEFSVFHLAVGRIDAI